MKGGFSGRDRRLQRKECKLRYRLICLMMFMLMLAGSWPSTVFALTAAEILALKKGGVSEETIRTMLQQEAAMKASAKDAVMGRQEIRDSEGNLSIQYSTGNTVKSRDLEQQKVDKAWEMLQHLIIDTRKKR
jgi:hypothetical protein